MIFECFLWWFGAENIGVIIINIPNTEIKVVLTFCSALFGTILTGNPLCQSPRDEISAMLGF